MSGTLRGIWYRRGRSLIVLLLATIATAAAVVIPSYTRAAQQTVLTDTLTAGPAISSGITASTKNRGGVPEIDQVSGAGVNRTLGEMHQIMSEALAVEPTLRDGIEPGIGAVTFGNTVVSPSVAPVQADLVYREQVCQHVRITVGACVQGSGEIMVSARTAQRIGWRVGDRVSARPETPANIVNAPVPEPIPFTVAGLFTPMNEREAYWGNTFYWSGFVQDPAEDVVKADALFIGAEQDIVGAYPGPRLTIEYPLRAAETRLDQVEPMRSGVAAVTRATARDLIVNSGFPATVASDDDQQAALSTSVPLVAVPLVLLCWFVLFLVVAALTEERGPEIALAKLRGLGVGQVARFGLAEPLLLVLVAAPLGLLLGLGATEAAARNFLADGVHAELRMPVWLVGAAALAGAALAAALATRRTVRASVLALLRRVPPRAPWRAAVVEAAVGALALAALYQIVVAGDRDSPIAYAAPPLLALVAGLLAARALGWWARVRTRTAGTAGNLPALLAAAQVSRRPAVARVVALLAVAVALLTFATAIWDVAGVNREIATRASTGADGVYRVIASDPQHLLDAVRAADPTGREAMAVAWNTQRYEGRDLLVAGVDAGRLGAVADWPGLSPERTAAIGSALTVQPGGPVSLRGPTVEVDAIVTRLVQQQPARLAVVVAVAGRPRAVRLPPIQVGNHTYRADLAGCTDGCRLLGLQVVRAAADVAETSMQLTVTGIRDGGRSVDVRLGADGGWRVPNQPPVGQSLQVAPTGQDLSITATTSSGDVTVDYADYPAATPVVVAGRQPSPDPHAGQFSFVGLGFKLSEMRVVDREVALPGVGSPALLFDLNAELRQAERSGPIDPTSLQYEVWTAPGAGPDLPARLTDAGLQVIDQTTQAQRQAELGRQAPGLALRLYLLAGVVAALLAAGVLLLNARVGARTRIAELTALRVVGVPRRTLRAALRREYLMVLVAPLVIGTAAGIGGAILLLPAIPLVTVGPDALAPVFRAGPWWVPGALLALVVCLALAVGSVLRMVGRADPRRVPEGEIG